VKALEFICWKVIKSMPLISSFSFHILVGLTFLDLHLSIQAWYRNYLHPTRLNIICVSLLTPCGKEIKQSQYPWEAEQFEPNFNPCKVKPNTHAWSTVDSLPSNHLLLIPVHGSVPLSPTTGNHHIHAPVVLRNKNNILSLRESGRYVHLPGRSVTRLTAYHIYGMWLVLSNT